MLIIIYRRYIEINYSQELRKEFLSDTRKKLREYRIYDKQDRKIYAVRTVKFDESLKGSDLLRIKHEDEDGDIISLYRTEEESTDKREEEHEEPEEEIDETREEEEREERNEEEIQRPGRRGRKPGITNEEHENVWKVELLLKDEKLREQGVRRSGRIEAKKHQANAAKHISIPTSFTQAKNSTEAKKWHEAMKREIEAMEHHKVWKNVPRSKGMKIIKSKWVYSLKSETNDSVEKYKARLVAVGCSQREGIDYTEAFSPVIKMESFRALMAIASTKKMRIKQYDVKTAYLYGHLDKPVYMEQPEGFVNQKTMYVN